MRLSLHRFETGVETIGGNRVVYDVDAESARFGASAVDGPALVWQMDHDEGDAQGASSRASSQLDPFASWVLRCDRVDFPLGGVARLHTHPGPGSAISSRARSEIETEGRSSFYGPGERVVRERARARARTGFDAPPDLVRPRARPACRMGWEAHDPLPRSAAPRDPKQSATVLLEHAIALPR